MPKSSDELIDAETLRQHLPEFLVTGGVAENGLLLLRHEDVYYGIFNGEIIVYTPQEFIYENLAGQREKLINLLKEFFGGRVQVKILTGEENYSEGFCRINVPDSEGFGKLNKENGLRSSIGIVSEKVDIKDRSLIEQKIISLFGAEDITNRLNGD